MAESIEISKENLTIKEVDQYICGFQDAVELIVQYIHYRHVFDTWNEYKIDFKELQNIVDAHLKQRLKSIHDKK